MLTLNLTAIEVSMAVYDYNDYKRCVNDWIESQPSGGHGQLRKLATYLNINSVVMSQVFRGTRELTIEQALGVAKFMGLTELETEFFLLLVQKSKAGHHELKAIFERQLEKIRIEAQALKNRIKHERFGNEEKATFYSQWYYSAVRLSSSISNLHSIPALADFLGLDRAIVARVVDFLLNHKLLIEQNGRLNIGPQVTHVGHDSPFVNRHHLNWRLRGMQSIDQVAEDDLFYTGPMALSKNAANEIRKLLVEVVEKSTKKAATSDSEVLRCLNIDWFKASRRV